MTDYKEFARQIKEKYPVYKDIDDEKLAKAMIEKYPVYADKVTFKQEYKEPKAFQKITNEDIKQYYQNKIDKRKEYEKEHPYLSTLQKDFQPLYRSNLVDWEEKAKYGLKAPAKVQMQNLAKRVGQDAIPITNIGVAAATKNLGPAGAGLLSQIGRGALQGTVQGATLGATHELGDNGLSLNVIPETLKSGALGLGIGAVLPPALTGGGYVLNKGGELLKRGVGKLAQISPETVEQVIKPTSKALDYTKEKAQDVLRSTTERVRDAYNNLLKQRGDAISTAEENLRNIPERVSTNDIIGDIQDTFNQYQGENINPARNMAGGLEDDLIDLVESGRPLNEVNEYIESLSPIDLQKVKQQIGQMTNWQDTTRPKIQNTVLEQVYGKLNKRLQDLSPELAQANADYAALKGFQNDEGLKTILAPGGAIDRASTALKNYNSTVSKGNTAQNIQALENTLVKEGEEPFLATMDDINAAMDLLKQERTGLGSIAELGKSLITRPALKVARWYNNSKIPQAFSNVRNGVQRSVIPMASPLVLYGGISNTDEDY